MSTKRPPVLNPPQVRRRKRALSEDERVLWDSVAKQTRPLRVRKPRAVIATDDVAPAPAIVLVPQPVMPPAKPAPKPRLRPLDAPVIAPALAPLGRRDRSSLSRGKTAIEARIDLHGMTQHRAHDALLTFLHRARRDGLTYVLVITGKGRTTGAASERGILRRQVPLWLSLPEFRMMVTSYQEAGIGHGGEGALYVRIRRER